MQKEKLRQKTEYTGILPDTGFAFKGDEPVEGVEAKKMVNRKQIYVEARNLLQIARFFNTEFLTKFYWEKWYNLLQNKSSDTG